MMNPANEILLGRVGALSQLGSLTLIVLFVGALFRSGRRSEYFARWAIAWCCFMVALLAVVLQYAVVQGRLIDPSTDAASGPLLFLLKAAYTTGKLGFFAFLLSGTQQFVDPSSPPLPRWMLALSLPVAGTAIVAMVGSFANGMIWQSVIAVPVFTCSAWLVLGQRQKPATPGRSALGLAYVLLALLWALYAIGLLSISRMGRDSPLQWLLTYNSFIDAVIQTLLAYGMVLVVMEEATHESQVAHAELEVAHHALRKAAYDDPLSGAYNRRAFAEGIGLESLEYGTSTLAVLDVDNLKAVNDALGHEAGDFLIRHVAAAARQTLRDGDALYRWGGDEFLVVFPNLGVAEARQLLDGAMAKASALSIGGIVVPVRASVGYVALHDRTDLERAIRRADRAMYEVKVAKRASTSERALTGIAAAR